MHAGLGVLEGFPHVVDDHDDLEIGGVIESHLEELLVELETSAEAAFANVETELREIHGVLVASELEVGQTLGELLRFRRRNRQEDEPDRDGHNECGSYLLCVEHIARAHVERKCF